ncbi:FMN-binding negative transcriptional regulator [Phaeobacter sp. QD34_3]|uniref:FMN-binding negative transcriptional regulator n=1 Tax=unclassified Phaeobacter TaxID=2621772 RepID=UPI00237EF358|nr:MULTISPECIES: FMN-binding negative transcriptional regulator [unclassified Phaeobacter]MDE4132284.1 FMN-binding negative transcriptional regulator [Phaeobacter sp. QD34_3]MDE4135922.1 FMN-binding negative transcriptional regulator [Phaeobacter sp. QD34_24]
MHPNPIFHDADTAQNLQFARMRAFGVLAISADEAPLLSHVPFLLSDDGTYADLHLVRSNPIARALATPQPARLAVSGPDGYISPDWYGLENQVPTWNYIAVHLTGRLERRPDDELRDLLDRQSAFYEARLLPKPPWTSAKMDASALDRLMRMIVPVRLEITGVDGTWKLSQNKPEAARLGAAGSVSGGFGAELEELSSLMREAKGP